MKKRHLDPRIYSARVSKIILGKHFAWCKKESRNISWYEATSSKLQAASDKQQATSSKRQAATYTDNKIDIDLNHE